MKLGKLEFSPITDRLDLLSEPTKEYLLNLAEPSKVAWVAEIDPIYSGGAALCAHYDIDLSIGGNCIVITASRGEKRWYAACLVPPESRIDLNGFVRKHLQARRVSLAPKDDTIHLTNMEYGSINIIGLPHDWPLLVDAALAKNRLVVMGSGLVKSKIAISGAMLSALPNAEVLDGLALR